MKDLLRYLSMVTDNRQEKKVLHKMDDIIAIVFFAMLAGADEWTGMKYSGGNMRGFCGGI